MHARAEQPIHSPEEKNSEFLFLRGELSRLLIPVEKSQLLTKFEEKQIHNLLAGLQSRDFTGNPEKTLKNFFTLFNQPVRRTPEFNRLRNQVYFAFEKHGLLQRFTGQETAPLEAHLYQDVAEYYDKTKANKKKISENEKNYVAELEYAILNIANPDDAASLRKIEQLLQKTLPAYSYADMEKARKNGTTIEIGTDEYRQLKEKIRLFLENLKKNKEVEEPEEEEPPSPFEANPQINHPKEAEPPVNLPVADVSSDENMTNADFVYGAGGAGELPRLRAVTWVRPARGSKNLQTPHIPTPGLKRPPLSHIEDHHPLPPEDIIDDSIRFTGDIEAPPEITDRLPSITRSRTEKSPDLTEGWSDRDDELFDRSFSSFNEQPDEQPLESSPTQPYPPEIPRNTVSRRLELALLDYSPTPTEAESYNEIQRAVAAYISEPSEIHRHNIVAILDEIQNEISERLVDNTRRIEYHTKEFIDLTAQLYKILESKDEEGREPQTQEHASPEQAITESLKNYLETHTSGTSEWLEQYEEGIVRDVLNIIEKGESFEEIQSFLSEVIQWQQQNTIHFDSPFLEVFQPACTFYQVEIPPYLARPSILQTTRGMPAIDVAKTLFEASQQNAENRRKAQNTPLLVRLDSPEPIVLHDDPMATSVEAIPERRADDLVDPTLVEPEEEDEMDFFPAKIDRKVPDAKTQDEEEEEDEINIHDTSRAEPQDAEEKEILEEILDLEPGELKEFRKNFPKMAKEERVMATNIITHLKNENLKGEEFRRILTNIPFDRILSPYFTEFLRTIDSSFFESANQNLIDAMDAHTLHEVGEEGDTKIFGNYREAQRKKADRKKTEDATTVKAKQGALRQKIRSLLGDMDAAYIPEEFYRHFKNPEDFTSDKAVKVLTEQRIQLSNELLSKKISVGEIGRAFEGEEPSFLGKLFSSKERKWAARRNQILSDRLALRWRAMDQMLKKLPTILP